MLTESEPSRILESRFLQLYSYWRPKLEEWYDRGWEMGFLLPGWVLARLGFTLRRGHLESVRMHLKLYEDVH